VCSARRCLRHLDPEATQDVIRLNGAGHFNGRRLAWCWPGPDAPTNGSWGRPVIPSIGSLMSSV